MPADEYSSVVRGGLKLKGGSGVTKKKKKSKAKLADGEKKDAIQKALEDEDASTAKEIEKRKVEGDGEGEEEGDRELEERGNDGKTASERAYEEMRRKRVCLEFTSMQASHLLIMVGSCMSACKKRELRRIRRRWRS
jgi:protein FAM32A